MSEETDAIRQDIVTVRESMSDKLEQLEAQVRGNVDTTFDKVRDTVDTTVDKVRDTVDTTIDSVHSVFDIQQHVSNHPWAALGVAALAGYLIGNIGGGSSARSSTPRPGQPMRYYDYDERHERGRARRSSALMDDLNAEVGPELNLITSAAIAAALHMFRDTVKENVPQFDEEYAKQRQDASTDQGEVTANARIYQGDNL